MQLPSDTPCDVIPVDGEPCGGSGGGSGGGGGGGGSSTGVDVDPSELARGYHPQMGTNNPISCKIQNMTVREHKESWIAGGSELSLRSVLNTTNGHINGDLNAPIDQYLTMYDKTNLLGIFFRKFKRSDINNGNSIFIGLPLQTNWPTSIISNGPVYYDLVFFEKDIWPTGYQKLARENEFFILDQNNITNHYNQNYRSSDIFYDVNRITVYPSAVTSSLGNNINATYGNGFTSTMFYNGGTRNSFFNSITYNVIPY